MLLFSCQGLSMSLATTTDLKRRDYCISFYVTMTTLPDDVIVMTGHNGRIDGDTETNNVG